MPSRCTIGIWNLTGLSDSLLENDVVTYLALTEGNDDGIAQMGRGSGDPRNISHKGGRQKYSQESTRLQGILHLLIQTEMHSSI